MVKREKGYWAKRVERYRDRATATSRAKRLREVEHTAHVKVVASARGEVEVRYSVATWYLEELEKAGLTL